MLPSLQPCSLLCSEGANLGCLHMAGAGLRPEDMKLGQGKAQPDSMRYLKLCAKALLAEPTLLFDCPEKQAQHRRWDSRGGKVYPPSPSGGDECRAGTWWEWMVPQRGEGILS